MIAEITLGTGQLIIAINERKVRVMMAIATGWREELAHAIIQSKFNEDWVWLRLIFVFNGPVSVFIIIRVIVVGTCFGNRFKLCVFGDDLCLGFGLDW